MAVGLRSTGRRKLGLGQCANGSARPIGVSARSDVRPTAASETGRQAWPGRRPVTGCGQPTACKWRRHRRGAAGDPNRGGECPARPGRSKKAVAKVSLKTSRRKCSTVSSTEPVTLYESEEMPLGCIGGPCTGGMRSK